MAIFDSLTNLVAQLGVGNAKTASDQFTLTLRTDQELDALYRGDWMGRKIVDLPVRDLLRPWRAWQAKPEQITAIDAAEKRHAVKAKLSLAWRAARLYGGAAIIIGADTANPSLPFNLNAVGKGGLRYLTVVPKRLLVCDDPDRDPVSPTFGEPRSYTLSSTNGGQVRIHPSRVIRFIGAERLDFDLNADGWGDSALLAVFDAIHHAALTQAGIAELVHEAKVDVIKIKDLSSSLRTTEGTTAVAKRFANANSLKSLNRMLLLDENETWERKQTSFANLADILDRYMQIVAGASDIPATRLLGTQAKGLGETGQGDLTNYYDMLAGLRDDILAPIMDRLDPILWRDATGAVPADTYAEWRPYWQMSDKDKAAVAKTKAETSQIYVNMGLLPDDALAKGIANQLIEDAVYPGVEAELAKVQLAEPREGDGDQETDDNPLPN